MNLATTPIKLTYEDYLEFPEDGDRHEIIDGDHVVTPSPNTRHQRLVGELFARLRGFAHERSLGEVFVAPYDVVLSEHDVVQPDVLFIAREHVGRIGEAHVEGPPDLVVEIVSEATRRRDEVLKRHLYERHGVREYWLADPLVETVKIFRRTEEDRFERLPELTREAGETLSTPLLPGLDIAVPDLFV